MEGKSAACSSRCLCGQDSKNGSYWGPMHPMTKPIGNGASDEIKGGWAKTSYKKSKWAKSQCTSGAHRIVKVQRLRNSEGPPINRCLHPYKIPKFVVSVCGCECMRKQNPFVDPFVRSKSLKHTLGILLSSITSIHQLMTIIRLKSCYT